MLKKPPINALTAMGTFWIFFGMIVLTSVVFVDDPVGKWADFFSSIVFLLLGIFTFYKGWKKKSNTAS